MYGSEKVNMTLRQIKKSMYVCTYVCMPIHESIPSYYPHIFREIELWVLFSKSVQIAFFELLTITQFQT